MAFSDLRDEACIVALGNALLPISKIVANEENAKARKSGALEFASAVLRNNPSEVKAIVAISKGVEPEDYHCDPFTLFQDVMATLNDPMLMQLFGLQSKKTGQTCSGSRSENTEAPKQ